MAPEEEVEEVMSESTTHPKLFSLNCEESNLVNCDPCLASPALNGLSYQRSSVCLFDTLSPRGLQSQPQLNAH